VVVEVVLLTMVMVVDIAVVDIVGGIVNVVFIDDAAVVGDVVIVSDGRG